MEADSSLGDAVLGFFLFIFIFLKSGCEFELETDGGRRGEGVVSEEAAIGRGRELRGGGGQ